MQNSTVILATLDSLKRLPNSRFGNPRYEATLMASDGSEVVAWTKPDASLGYSLPNHRGEQVQATLRTMRGRVYLIGCEKAA